MPKFTETGKEVGSSECPALVLGKTAYTTNQKVLENHRATIAGVEKLNEYRPSQAQDRGNFLEEGIAKWACKQLHASFEMPEFAHQNKELKMGASIDAIISSDLGINISDPITQEEFTFNGDGILEIKTDFYHMDKPREEWVIQVHHQMICSDYTWGIIAVLNQKGHLKIYPVPRDEDLIDDIIYKVNQFWSLVDSGEDYPPYKEPTVEAVNLVEVLKDSNDYLDDLCGDYLSCMAEARKKTKEAQNIKDGIIIKLESIGVEQGYTNNYQLKSQDIMRKKRKQIQTDEDVPGHIFSIKEISHE
tara:strand:+ start:991 stop:1899 length:909 start_codon:yes stop_codon:yes gene_type:complete